jgi:hypothetical protein
MTDLYVINIDNNDNNLIINDFMKIISCQFIDINNNGNGGSMFINNTRNIIIE